MLGNGKYERRLPGTAFYRCHLNRGALSAEAHDDAVAKTVLRAHQVDAGGSCQRVLRCSKSSRQQVEQIGSAVLAHRRQSAVLKALRAKMEENG